MALFTGKGDKGTTKLFDSKQGERVSKTSDIFEALGTLDELNAVLGLCKVHTPRELHGGGEQVDSLLHTVQDHIFTAQAELAGAEKYIPESSIQEMEMVIERIEKELPEIKTFFVPGGCISAAWFDFARTVSRRAERRVLAVCETGDRDINEHTRTYLNRLSSLLYAFARLANHSEEMLEKAPRYR